MGGFVSRPSAPAAPPPAAVAKQPAPVKKDASGKKTNVGQSNAAKSAAGQSGTKKTGSGGVLAPADTTKKTLLGN